MNQEVLISAPEKSFAGTDSPATGNIVLSFMHAVLLLAKPGIALAEVTAAVAGMLLATPVGLLSFKVTLLLVATITLGASGAALANGLLEAATDRRLPRLAARVKALDLVGGKTAWVIAMTAMIAALLLSAYCLNLATALLLTVTFIAYLWCYTAWLKHTSPLALLVGAIPGALPPLIGAAAVGSITPPALLLALIIFLWQLPHFAFLALRDQEQYLLAGLPVFPAIYGARTTRGLILVSTVALVPLPVFFGVSGSCSWLCAMLLVVVGAALLGRTVWALRRRDRYGQGFLASLLYLGLTLGLLILDQLLRLSGGGG